MAGPVITIKAIDTEYGGCLYRSRLEARWAVFFDTLGIRYYYEHEGYDLNGIYYLPDFYIPEQKGVDRSPFFIEIKGQEPTAGESEKMELLSIKSDLKVFCFWGDIKEQGEQYSSSYMFGGRDLWDCSYWWCECSKCGILGIQYEGRSDRLACKQCNICVWLSRGEYNGPYSYRDSLGNFSCPNHGGTWKQSIQGCPNSGGNLDKGYNFDSPRLIKAYRAARVARF